MSKEIEVDKRFLPSKEGAASEPEKKASKEQPFQSETESKEDEVNNDSELLAEKEAELSALQKQTIELQKQKEHWREKYERDVKENAAPPSEPVEEEYVTDEGQALRKELAGLKSEISTFKRNQEKTGVYSKYPQLEDKEEEFKEFQSEYPDVPLEKVAKVFLVEKDLLDKKPIKRKGLEKPTSGTKAPPSTGMSVEEVQQIRTTQPRRYIEMLKKGQIKTGKMYS
ncbi:hypothetical protein CMI37_11710 [Candidatus Pacearchaeota archaeon]|nr:hypothetical protein [Candidatus Pacearchaeota archaeon]|tara:strand:- start:6029 stop:6706 length:678 start_codon:yes stop_codon:yes gene_type:complete